MIEEEEKNIDGRIEFILVDWDKCNSRFKQQNSGYFCFYMQYIYTYLYAYGSKVINGSSLWDAMLLILHMRTIWFYGWLIDWYILQNVIFCNIFWYLQILR